jgi:hypothetical protein
MEVKYLKKWKYDGASSRNVSSLGALGSVLEKVKCTPVNGGFNAGSDDLRGLRERTLPEMVSMDLEATGNFWGVVQTFVAFYGMKWTALKKEGDKVSHVNKEEFDENVLKLGRVFVMASKNFDIVQVLAEE